MHRKIGGVGARQGWNLKEGVSREPVNMHPLQRATGSGCLEMVEGEGDEVTSTGKRRQRGDRAMAVWE